MNYATGADFRRALEARLRQRALSTGAPLVRLRKMAAFDRFMARLQETQPSPWLLKGGFALQLRFADRREAACVFRAPRRAQRSSRVRDFADILLIASVTGLHGANLREAIRQTFEARATHSIPEELPALPGRWFGSFRRLNSELELGWEDLGQATEAARSFLDPIIAGVAAGSWDPARWAWGRNEGEVRIDRSPAPPPYRHGRRLHLRGESTSAIAEVC